MQESLKAYLHKGRTAGIMYGMNALRLRGFVAVFDAIAVFILYPRLDVFSVGYLVISTGLAVLQAVVSNQFCKSPELQRLFYAKDIDPSWHRWVPILGIFELGVFYEYAHLRLIPALLKIRLQTAGLALCALGTVWLLWVDTYLVREFQRPPVRCRPLPATRLRARP